MTHAALSSEDPRTERVKHALRNTLFIALQNEPLHQLTVSTLTRKAKVSRGVFYKHFETLDDLVVDTLVQKIEGALANTFPFREGPIPYLQALCGEQNNCILNEYKDWAYEPAQIYNTLSETNVSEDQF